MQPRDKEEGKADRQEDLYRSLEKPKVKTNKSQTEQLRL
jgi:hypothetical protein